MTVNAYIDLDTASDTQLFQTGSEYNADGVTYIYAKASGALTQYDLAQLSCDATTGIVSATSATTTTAGGASSVLPADFCIPQIAVTDAYYFWAPVGPFKAKPRDPSSFFYVRAGAAAVSSAKLYTTGTAGCIDDVSTSTVCIEGLVLLTAVTGAANAKCIATKRLTANS